MLNVVSSNVASSMHASHTNVNVKELNCNHFNKKWYIVKKNKPNRIFQIKLKWKILSLSVGEKSDDRKKTHINK